ncbi:helix-turn-helix domain-containing protein [Brachybacterium sp. YJGR34]|uniref:helix-turn-helix domain-containing protein n=1 Tax=Brachybacterium sp. YJGR34 TaxID=2059911 RepID=UPI000E0AB18C|nr:XRE family transcriptional regulator [Brachybacterium sp. YJGR34]
MTQESGSVDGLVRQRIRALRLAQGLSLADLATRAHLSQSTLSRIENGQRRLALDQLVTLARALDTGLDELVETDTEEVVANPVMDHGLDSLRWQPRHDPDLLVLRRRLTEPPPALSRMRAHPGHEWMVVLSGTVTLLLGEHRYRITTNQSAEFPTMLPHAFGAEGAPADVLMIVDREARRGHRETAPDEADTPPRG